MKLSDLHWLNKPNLNIKLKNLPHGIIISGPIGLGKEILALFDVDLPSWVLPGTPWN